MISQRVERRWYVCFHEWIDRFFLFTVVSMVMFMQVMLAAQVFSDATKDILDGIVMGWSIHEILLGVLSIWLFLPLIRAGLYTGYWYYKHGTLTEPRGETA